MDKSKKCFGTVALDTPSVDEIVGKSKTDFIENTGANLAPLFSEGGYTTETPDCKSVARFSKGEFDKSLNIDLSSSTYGVGKWVCDFPIPAGKTYKLLGACITECCENDVYFLFTLFDKDGNMLTRDHVENCVREGEHLFFHEVFFAPDECVGMRIEMWLKGTRASVKWLQPHLIEVEPIKKRPVRVSISYIAPDGDHLRTVDDNVDVILKSIDESAKFNPDLIVLSEGMNSRNTGVPLQDHAEDVETGRICGLIRKKAAEHNSYIVYNFHEKDNGEYYNTSALFGRRGEICGKYRKTHLTVTELEKGLTPGNSYPVFDTDFGKLGILICWDHYFNAPAEELAKAGAEIVAVSSAGDANAKAIARAMDGGIWYAIAGWNTGNDYGWGPGRIISPDGTVVAHTNETFKPANFEIDLNEKIRIKWLSLGDAMTHVKPVYRYQKHDVRGK